MASPQKTIGIFVYDIDRRYVYPLLLGFRRAADAAGARLIYFPGRPLNFPAQRERQHNLVYSLAGPAALDGLVVVSSTLQLHIANSEMQRFIDTLPDMPLVSLGVEIQNRCSVLTGNREGFYKLTRHFLVHHAYRRVAFIKGPPDSEEAYLRWLGFQQAHEELGIPVYPELLVQGFFNPESGVAAMQELLARDVPFDALLACNDDMALSALNVGIERGRRIPEDFAVGGFDDFQATSRFGISLTTVNQEAEESAVTTLTRLNELIEGNNPPAINTVATRLVIRHSCGCLGARETELRESPQTDKTPKTMIQEMITALSLPEHRQLAFSRYVELIIKAIEHDLPLRRLEQLDRVLTEIADECILHETHIGHLQSVLLEIHQYLLPRMDFDDQQLIHSSELMLRAFIRVSDHLNMYLQSLVAKQQNIGREFVSSIKQDIQTFNLPTLLSRLTDGLVKIGVESCYIAIYTEPGYLRTWQDAYLPPQARLIYALQNRQRLDAFSAEPYASKELVPDKLLQKEDAETLVVVPLFFEQEHFGFVILPLRLETMEYVGLIREELSSAIMACLVANRIQLWDPSLL